MRDYIFGFRLIFGTLCNNSRYYYVAPLDETQQEMRAVSGGRLAGEGASQYAMGEEGNG